MKDDDCYAINLAKTELREAYKSADVNRILALFADSFTDMREGQASFWGSDAKIVLKETLEALFREHEVELTPAIINIIIAGDIAVEHGWHELTRRPKAGGPVEIKRTRYVEVWRRGANQAWQIILFIDNADRKPELVEQALLRGGMPTARQTQNL